jgi:DNA-binding response OmpR family regulator
MATILVVDDDPAARKPLARLLKMEGYEVVCAENAIMAMAQAIGRHPDLILLDVAMPPMDGLTFLFLLRERTFGKDVPVIVLSGHGDAHTMERARKLGVCEFVVKSEYRPRKLLELIRHHCLKSAGDGAPTATAADAGGSVVANAILPDVQADAAGADVSTGT